MSKRYIHIFDLDNTLCYTDHLNNYSYNTALLHLGLYPINSKKRITRNKVFEVYNELNSDERDELTSLKQKIFLSNIDKIKLNNNLISLLKKNDKQNNVLWTSADSNRAMSLLTFFNLKNLFEYLVFSEKQDIEEDIKYISLITNSPCDSFIFYEDNMSIINKLKLLNMKVEVIQCPSLQE